MTKLYRHLTYVLVILVLAAGLIRRYPMRPIDVGILTPSLEKKDPESILVFGKRLSLGIVDMYSLELIPGVSDTLAQGILKNRSAILRRARNLPLSAQCEALMIAKGIGPKMARKLAFYLNCVE